MKLTAADKELLIKWGYEKDIPQIERACGKTTYIMNGQRIAFKSLLEIMDRETWLSGIARSAFHYSALRQTKKGENVYFDSSRFFKEG